MSDEQPPRSRCPHCGARGTYLDDSISTDGYTLHMPYCGHCGRNWPKDTDRTGQSVGGRLRVQGEAHG